MARRGKTKIGGPQRRVSREGNVAEQRARARATDRTERQWGQISGQIQQGAQQFSQEQVRQEQRSDRESEIAGQEKLAREGMDLRAAGQGMERDPEFARREKALEEEMARGEEQATAPGELEGSRFIPTERREGQEARAEAREEKKLELQQSRIDVARETARASAARALGKGDLAGYKTNRENYAAQMKSTIGIADKITRGDAEKLTPSERDAVKKWAAKNPDPALKQEVESGIYGPRTAQLVRGRAFADSLPFVALRGDFPDPDLIDYTHPKYQEFVGVYVPEAKDWLRQRQAVAPITGITSFEDAQRLIRQSAAMAMMQTQMMSAMRTQAQSQGAQDSPELPTPSVNPNAPPPPPPGQQGEQQQASPYPTEGAGTMDVQGHGQSWGQQR